MRKPSHSQQLWTKGSTVPPSQQASEILSNLKALPGERFLHRRLGVYHADLASAAMTHETSVQYISTLSNMR